MLTGNRTRDDSGGLAAGAFAQGALTVIESVVSDNTAASSGTGGGLGAGLVANGVMTIVDSTISGNISDGGTTFAGSSAAIFTNSPVNVIGSTISGNRARAGGAFDGHAAGIGMNDDLTLVNSTVTSNVSEGANSTVGGVIAGGDLTIVYSTIVGNSASSPASAANVSQADAVFGSVIAQPLGGAPTCGQPAVTSNGFSFSDDATCGLTNVAAGDREDAGDPMLAALTDNGGPTMTLLPLAGSPLVDAVPLEQCQAHGDTEVATDQRALPPTVGRGV